MKLFAISLAFLTVALAKPHHEQDGRIINGILAAKGQFPYQVAVLMKLTNNYIDRCGGALISTEWVLTAAHCLSEPGLQSISVVLGSTSLSRETDPNLVSINASKWIPHENYTKTQAQKYDIGLVKLATPATLTDRIKTIALNTELIKADTTVTIAGWGLINGNIEPNDLRYILEKVIPEDDCKKIYGKNVVNDVICTISNDGTIKTVCAGDSGGPLVTNTTNGLVVIGALSFEAAQCGSKLPDGYSRVDVHRAWIKNITGI